MNPSRRWRVFCLKATSRRSRLQDRCFDSPETQVLRVLSTRVVSLGRKVSSGVSVWDHFRQEQDVPNLKYIRHENEMYVS